MQCVDPRAKGKGGVHIWRMAKGGRVGAVFMDSCDANKMGGGLRTDTRIPTTLGPALEFYMGGTLGPALIFGGRGTNLF